MSLKKLIKNSSLSIFSKIINALIQLVSIPILLKIFGKENYGLIVLALSLNTFIAILQLGLPSGFPKYVAEYLVLNNNQRLNSSIRTATSFYLIIALLNLFLLLSLAGFGIAIFKLSSDQVEVFRVLLIITAITSFFSIPATTIDQLLIGAQELGYASGLDILKNLFFAGLVGVVFLNPNLFTLTQFYVIRCSLMFLMIPFKLYRWTKYGSLSDFIPGWDFKGTLPLVKYCLSLMTFSVFGMFAEKIRPIILGMRATTDVARCMSDYQIIDGIRVFLMMVVSSFMIALIPYITAVKAKGDISVYTRTIIYGTKYTWTIGAFICFGIIMFSEQILCIYVGSENIYLERWLNLTMFGALYNLYVAPIISVVLSSGKLRPMIFATGIACFVSVVCCWFLIPSYGLGGVACSLVAYNCVHFIVIHFWYLPKYFMLNSYQHLYKILLPPIIAGIAMCVSGRYVLSIIGNYSSYAKLFVGGIVGLMVYMVFISIFYIKPIEGKQLFFKVVKG